VRLPAIDLSSVERRGNSDALPEDLGMRPHQAHCHRRLGTPYARAGRRQQAHSRLATAIELYRTMDMTF
jgi:hypothetical protein